MESVGGSITLQVVQSAADIAIQTFTGFAHAPAQLAVIPPVGAVYASIAQRVGTHGTAKPPRASVAQQVDTRAQQELPPQQYVLRAQQAVTPVVVRPGVLAVHQASTRAQQELPPQQYVLLAQRAVILVVVPPHAPVVQQVRTRPQ